MADTIIFHIDVNNAFLSWEAIYRLKELHETVDIRTIPAVIGGNEETRHGIVLAKSPLAKSCGIITGEPLSKARQKCSNISVFSPNFKIYTMYSHDFMELLKEYAPVVDQFSIDEAFCDMTGTSLLYGDMVEFAHKLKDIIKNELGFTVNIGISTNKLLAKMASDFQKPDKVHTLFPSEIADKLWKLPVNDLLFVGHSSAAKLNNIGLFTIGDLAHCDKSILNYHFGKHGDMMWNYANGLDDSVLSIEKGSNKGYGNSITIQYDVTDADTAKMILLSLCETVGARLRYDNVFISVVSITIVDSNFHHHSKQCSLESTTNVTAEIYNYACELFDICWNNAPIRLLGVSTAKASTEKYSQYNLFDKDKYEKLQKLDSTIDNIRSRYGNDSVKRARFIDSEHKHMTGKSK